MTDGRPGSIVILSALLVLSCGGNVLDGATSQGGGGQRGQTIAGGDQDGGGGPTAPSVADRGEAGLLPNLPPERADGGLRNLAPSVEVWIGESDLPLTLPLTFPPSTKPARLVLILQDATGGITGTITFGDAPPPPPPTSPDVLYPEGMLENFQYAAWTSFPIEGFDYSLAAVHREKARLLVQFSPGELWARWCALQTSYPHTDGVQVEYYCVPAGAERSDSSTPTPVKADLCDGVLDPVCRCDVAGCGANLETVRTIELVPDGSDLVGQAEGGGGISVVSLPTANIRLRRVQ